MTAQRSTTQSNSPWLVRFFLNDFTQDAIVVLLVLVFLFPLVEVLMGHQASRMALTGAVTDDATIVIDGYQHLLTVDYAESNGRLLSDKAPGQPFLAIPFYWIGTTLFGLDPIKGDPQKVVHYGNITLWWLTFWSSTVPLAILGVTMRRAGKWVTGSKTAGLAAALSMVFASLLLPFGSVLFAHVLAALLGFGCWFFVRNASQMPSQLQTWRMVVSGILGGLAVLTEYTTAMVVIAVGLLLLITQRLKVSWYILAGLPFAGLLLLYNQMAWGSPLSFSYTSSGSFSQYHQVGLFGIRLPDPVLLLQVLFGERGIFLMTPICLIGFIGLFMLMQHRQSRVPAIMCMLLFTSFALVQGGWWSVTAGASPGPRYVVAGLPFLAIGVAYFWQWSKLGVVIMSLLGGIPMLLATVTFPLAQPTVPWATGFWITRAMGGHFSWTLWHSTGVADWVAILIVTAVAVVGSVGSILVNQRLERRFAHM